MRRLDRLAYAIRKAVAWSIAKESRGESQIGTRSAWVGGGRAKCSGQSAVWRVLLTGRIREGEGEFQRDAVQGATRGATTNAEQMGHR